MTLLSFLLLWICMFYLSFYYIHWLILSQTSQLKKSHCCSSISSCMEEIHHREYQYGQRTLLQEQLIELHGSAPVNRICFLIETLCSWRWCIKFQKSTLALHAGMEKAPSESSSFMVCLGITSQVNYPSSHPHLKATHVLYESIFLFFSFLKLIYDLNSPTWLLFTGWWCDCFLGL